MTQPRMWWAGEEKGWIIDVEQALTLSELERSIDFTLRVQSDRYLTCGSGDRRDECAKTIVALRNKKVTQNIIGTGDKILYDAYKSEGRKVFA